MLGGKVKLSSRLSTRDSRPTLLLATRNPGKVREFRRLLDKIPLSLRDLREFPDAPEVLEDGDTYLANARLKALSLARFTGLPCLADDSGIEVDALGGAPGLYSARFAGPGSTDEANRDLLLVRMREVADEQRQARFRCALVVVKPNGDEIAAEGACEGFITREPHGGGGFGYDPIFYYPPASRTTAELRDTEKDRISHRAKACTILVPQLRGLLAADPPDH
jgi:XTP/dITP diphosphohydrolase